MKRTGAYCIMCLMLAGCGGGSGTESASTVKDGGENAETAIVITENNTTIPRSGIYDVSDDEQIKYLKVINYARSMARECKNNDGSVNEASKGSFPAASPLVTNSDLYASALEHSKDLAQSNTFSHSGSGTASDVTGSNLGHSSTFKERIEANGYTEYSAIGENIAAGQATIENAVHAWLESPGHCANIMNGKFKEMGLAKYEEQNSTYKIYWTNDFGG